MRSTDFSCCSFWKPFVSKDLRRETVWVRENLSREPSLKSLKYLVRRNIFLFLWWSLNQCWCILFLHHTNLKLVETALGVVETASEESWKTKVLAKSQEKKPISVTLEGSLNYLLFLPESWVMFRTKVSWVSPPSPLAVFKWFVCLNLLWTILRCF